MELMFWPIQGDPRLVAMPDAAFRNNSDKSSQRATVIFMAEPRKDKSRNTKGSLIFFESTKIKRTTLSTTVAELYALMKCYGTCQMLRGLIKDITGLSSEIHMRTDANNLVTTASTTHVPEQQETIHMIQMLRKEACSGSIADLSHIRTQWCLADCLTKKSANPQNLIDAVRCGILKEVDAHPPFRSLLEHKAYLRSWLPTVCTHVDFSHDVFLLGDCLRESRSLFEFVPAAQERETRETHCYFTMAGSNRWTRSSSRAQGSDDPNPFISRRRDDDDSSDERPNFRIRNHSEIPDNRNNYHVYMGENHIEYCYGQRHEADWKDSEFYTTLFKGREMYKFFKPDDMRTTTRTQILGDVLAWLEGGPMQDEYSDLLHWSGEFIRYLVGWVTQEEEDSFEYRCTEFQQDLTNKGYSKYFQVSKSLSTVLRHCKIKQLFSSTGTMELSNLITQMDVKPRDRQMDGRDFAAMLMSNNKSRFFVEIVINWEWNPYTSPPKDPFEVRIGAHQGHSNQSVDPYDLHHVLTYDEACSLGWIFHVTSQQNRSSIEANGLRKDPKGTGKGGRDAVHFMYHNDNSDGYIRMASGTQQPRSYSDYMYVVLRPDSFDSLELFLTKNGVVLVYGNVPSRYLKIMDQLPTIAANVLRPGRGHILPSTVTGATWPDDFTWTRARKEKGITFVPGGDIPDRIRQTAWEFMNQRTPSNYARLTFGNPLSLEADFDPKQESVMNILGESSRQREESQDVNMEGSSPQGEEPHSEQQGRSPQGEEPDPEEGLSPQGEAPTGSSPQGEEPAQENYDNWWETPGEPSAAQRKADREAAIDAEAQLEIEAQKWVTEGYMFDDLVVGSVFRSVSSSNPWVYYESGIICARDGEGNLRKNSCGEKVINLREWDRLSRQQRIALRHQNIRKDEWEKLPWTGHMCYLFTRAWEIGRLKSHYMREKDFDEMRNVLENAKYYNADWMRGEDEPSAWDTRFEIPKDMWPERWHLYERSMAIQNDMEFFAEAVYTFYQAQLDKMIRKNPLLWGDFCKKLRKLNPETGNMEESDLLDLAMAPRATEVYADYNTVKPEPEKHFSFSTTLMVLAVELYFESVPDHKLCPYARYSYRTLMEFVESRKELTKESYRHFIEHAYNQFFQHEAFHSSACSKTHAKDLSAGNFKTSTKLKAYTWVTNDGRVARIKKTYATTYRMPDVPAQPVPGQAASMQDEEEDDVEEIEVENMEVEEVEEEKDDDQELVLQVVLEPDAAEILGIPPEDVLREQERQEEEVDYGSSPEGEEPRAELGHSSKEERPDLPYASTPMEKYGNFMVSQLTRKQENLLKHWNLSMGRFVEEDEGIPIPRRLEDINTFQTAMMIDVIAEANHTEFTMSYRALTGVDVSLETFHEMHVVCKHLRDKNAHILIKTFETEDDPQLPVNPRGKDMEYMIPEDKHIILEGDNSKLVDCTVTWLNMMNKDLQDRVLSRLREANKLQLKIEEVNEGEEAEEQESVKKDPVIPPPPRVSTEVQTDPQGSDIQGGSPQGEVPTSSTRSTKVEEVKKEKAQADDTAPKKEVTSTISSTSEITGNESSSVLRNLKDCFTGGYYGEWAGFYSSKPKPSAYVLASQVSYFR